MASDYRLLTTWVLDAEHEAVWDTIFAADRWPEWWPGVEEVTRVAEGDANGVGSVYRNTWRSRLPYAVRFDARTTRVERPHLIDVTATGELAGTGRWRFAPAPDALVLTYEWNVRTTQRWMNALTPLARRAFAWNHDYVMGRGGEALARRVGGRLLAHG